MTDYAIIVAQIRAMKPDLVYLENNKNFPTEQLNSDLGDMFGILGFIGRPSVAGFPVRRTRRYFMIWLLSKWEFSGTEKEFHQIFEEAPSMDADDFLVAPLDERTEMTLKFASDQGNHYEVMTPLSLVPFDHCFPPTQLSTLRSHIDAMPSQCNIKGTYVCDVDQNFGWATAGPWFPCLVTHGKIVSLSSLQIFTAKEHLAIQGEAVYEPLRGAGGECLFQEMLDNSDLGDVSIKRLAGQSMHLHFMAPFMLYGQACLTLKSDIESVG